LVIAQARGLIDPELLEVHRARGSQEQLAGLLAGDLDVVVTAIDNLFAWTRAGADVRLVAQIESTTAIGVYARAGVERIDDLAGTRFGVDAAANGFSIVARHLMESAGIDVEYVEVGGVRERGEALQGGVIDATLLGPPYDATAVASGCSLLTNVVDALPGFPGQGLVVRGEVAASPELVEYLAVMQRAVDLGASLDDEAGPAVLADAGFGGGAQAMWATRPRTLAVDPAGLDLLTEMRERLGLLPAGVDLHILHDPEPLRAAETRTS
jgi:ABC-type nitrate/sulfonate/bicarbonate transport system substrate-binding protein